MTTFDRYAMPSETDWVVPSSFETGFRFEFDRLHGIRPEVLRS